MRQGAGEEIIRAALARRLGEAACGVYKHRAPSNSDGLDIDFDELDLHTTIEEVLMEDFWSE
jgi:hypothetical protein